MATPRKSIKSVIASKRDSLMEKVFYDKTLNFYMVYDRLHNKKYYTDRRYDKDRKIISLFKKYPELTNVEIYGAFGSYLKKDELTFYTGIVVRAMIGPVIVRDPSTHRIGKGSLEDFYRLTDAV